MAFPLNHKILVFIVYYDSSSYIERIGVWLSNGVFLAKIRQNGGQRRIVEVQASVRRIRRFPRHRRIAAGNGNTNGNRRC